ncbi:MAG: hypothetical protein ACRENS_09330, partial [Candidatus Eiseniibacteriota bacterium]
MSKWSVWCVTALAMAMMAAWSAARAEEEPPSRTSFETTVGWTNPPSIGSYQPKTGIAFSGTMSFAMRPAIALDLVGLVRSSAYDGPPDPAKYQSGHRTVDVWGLGPALRLSTPPGVWQSFVLAGVAMCYSRMSAGTYDPILTAMSAGGDHESDFGAAPLLAAGVHARLWKYG